MRGPRRKEWKRLPRLPALPAVEQEAPVSSAARVYTDREPKRERPVTPARPSCRPVLEGGMKGIETGQSAGHPSRDRGSVGAPQFGQALPPGPTHDDAVAKAGFGPPPLPCLAKLRGWPSYKTRARSSAPRRRLGSGWGLRGPKGLKNRGPAIFSTATGVGPQSDGKVNPTPSKPAPLIFFLDDDDNDGARETPFNQRSVGFPTRTPCHPARQPMGRPIAAARIFGSARRSLSLA